jgi:hypothetical protein
MKREGEKGDLGQKHKALHGGRGGRGFFLCVCAHFSFLFLFFSLKHPMSYYNMHLFFYTLSFLLFFYVFFLSFLFFSLSFLDFLEERA